MAKRKLGEELLASLEAVRRWAAGEPSGVTELKPAPGLKCPRCGGRKLPAAQTRHRGDETRRLRVCRGCGYRVRTAERVVGGSPG